jgi:hypothetical protein
MGATLLLIVNNSVLDPGVIPEIKRCNEVGQRILNTLINSLKFQLDHSVDFQLMNMPAGPRRSPLSSIMIVLGR